jgi:steroid delta-isomerase-like uncharacterized protein
MSDQKEIEKKNKEIVRRYWDAKWNLRSPGKLDELQAPDVVYHSPSMDISGLAKYKQVYGMFAAALHDTHLTVDEIMVEGDKVMTRVSVRGTHKGEFEGIPPTGNTVNVTLCTVFRLVDGKIVEENELIDELALMTQIGMELRPKE